MHKWQGQHVWHQAINTVLHADCQLFHHVIIGLKLRDLATFCDPAQGLLGQPCQYVRLMQWQQWLDMLNHPPHMPVAVGKQAAV